MTLTSPPIDTLLQPVPADEPLVHLRPPVTPDSLEHRNVRRDEFWRKIPAWKDVDHETFASYDWQEKHAITSSKKLVQSVQELVSAAFINDIEAGFAGAPMAVRMERTVSGLTTLPRASR